MTEPAAEPAADRGAAEPAAAAAPESAAPFDPFAPLVASVRPEPEPEVMAAILAAVVQCWPRPRRAAQERPAPPMWRFSGRWWAKPTPARRERPWIGGSR